MTEINELVTIINKGLLSILDLEQYYNNGYSFLLENGTIKEIIKERE